MFKDFNPNEWELRPDDFDYHHKETGIRISGIVYQQALEGNKESEEFILNLLNTKPSMSDGVKYDNGKPLVGTLCRIFPNALLEVGKCIEFGTHKYPEVDNWQRVDDAFNRYQDAMIRHLLKHNIGKELDEETGLYHLSHMAWNALAILELYIRSKDETRDI